MSGLPAVPAFRHDPPVDPVASTSSSAAMSVDTVAAPVGDVVDAVPALGPWGCNAAADCTAVVVIQWAAPSPTDADPLRTVPGFACADHKGA